MFGQFEHQNQQQNKGLFTFYREQAERQEQIRRIKKQRKQAKIKQAEQKKKKQQQSLKQIKLSKQSKQSIDPETKIRYDNEFKSERSRKNLYQPKNRRGKYHKQQLGSSVVIVNSKQITNEHRPEQNQKSYQQKNNLKRIEQMINPHNNNRYFLQNRQLPIAFGKGSLQKLIVKNQEQQKEPIQTKNIIKQNYFNSYSTQQQKKYIPTFSYQKLPQLINNKPTHSQIILPKRYKSKKVEVALKSNNSELIRQIRQSLREQSILDKYSYIDANNSIIKNEQSSYQKQYENRLHSQLDAKQRRLIDILRHGSIARKNKHM